MAFADATLCSFQIRKKVGNPLGPDPLNVNGIYQVRTHKNKQRTVKMKFYVPTNPQTPAQQANRVKFANAMGAWGSLTQEQKNVYINTAKKRQTFGWSLFIREYYLNN